MAISGAEDHSLASAFSTDRSSGDECFSDDGGNDTDCISVCDDDDVGNGLAADVLEGDRSWLLRGLADALKDDDAWLNEEHPPEYYLEEEANLNPSCLRQLRYSPRTQEKLDWVREHWEQYCKFVGRDPVQAYDNLSIQSLKGFLSWLAYKRQTGKKIDEMIIKKILRICIAGKKLSRQKREKVSRTAVVSCCRRLYQGLSLAHIQPLLPRNPASVISPLFEIRRDLTFRHSCAGVNEFPDLPTATGRGKKTMQSIAGAGPRAQKLSSGTHVRTGQSQRVCAIWRKPSQARDS
ncbi:hypothetical protein VTO42DRAFT_770 [Malbranchea cinnamomea]